MRRDGSSVGPEAAALHGGDAKRPPMGGPGEDRRLTRHASRYAPGCWWGVFTPTGCLAASDRFSRIPDMLIAGIR